METRPNRRDLLKAAIGVAAERHPGRLGELKTQALSNRAPKKICSCSGMTPSEETRRV